MRLNRAWIEARIPHQERMCLLDEVVECNAKYIRCVTATHRASDNPLRSHGRLGSAGGIEYAAQAMALHGALAGTATSAATGSGTGDRGLDAATDAATDTATRAGGTVIDVATRTGDLAPKGSRHGPPQVGLLAGLRDVRLFVTRLDDIDSDLICEATHLAGDGLTALYEFALRDGNSILLSGRASVVLDAGGRLKL
jgi:predicted hotdog family 3-hydroxylacyl-ACP dehydratase